MANLWLIRHGQAAFGTDDYDCLSNTGERQAEITGEHLRAAGISFSKAYTGTLKRQIRTAELVLGGMGTSLPIIQSPLFDEYDHMGLIRDHLPEMAAMDSSIPQDLGDIGKDPALFQQIFSRIVDRWVSGKHSGSESQTYRRFSETVHQGIRKAAECTDRRPVLIFTSGGVASVVLQMALGIPPMNAMTIGWRIRNASISVFSVKPKEEKQITVAMDMFNCTAHLDIKNDPTLLTYR